MQYRFAAAWATLDELLLIRSISIDAVLRRLPLRHDARCFASGHGRRRPASRSSCSRSSFEGLYALLDFARRRRCRISAVRNLNIDAISPLVLPGHPDRRLAARAVLSAASRRSATCIGMIGLLAIAVADARASMRRPSRSAGICLGLSIAISSFAGLMVTAAPMLFEAVVAAPRVRPAPRASSMRSPPAMPLGLATGAGVRASATSTAAARSSSSPSTASPCIDFWWVTLAQLRAGADRRRRSRCPCARARAPRPRRSSARSRSRRCSSTSSSTSAITRTSMSAGASAISCSCRRLS